MLCIIKTDKKNLDKIEYVARKLAVGEDEKSKYEDYLAHEEMYKNIAYFMLSNNNGHMYDCDTNGDASKLWEKILLKHNGDERAAIIEKSLIYTPSYESKYGEWLYEGIAEPTNMPFGDDEDVDELKRQLDSAITTFETQNDQLLTWLDVKYAGQLLNEESVLNRGVDKKLDEYVKANMNNQKVEDEVTAFLSSNPSATAKQVDKVREQAIREQQYDLRRKFYVEHLNTIIDSITKSLASSYGLVLNENGIVDTSNMPNDENDALSQINIIRANFVNRIKELLTNPYYEILSKSLINLYLDGDVGSFMEVIPDMAAEYIDMYKNTRFLLKQMEDHFNVVFSFAKLRSYYQKVDMLKEDIKRYLKRSNENINDPEHVLWYKKVLDWIRAIPRVITYCAKWVKNLSYGVFLKEYRKERKDMKFLTPSATRTEYNKILRLLVMRASICENLRSLNEYQQSSNIDRIQLEKGDTLHEVLKLMLDNLEKRKASVTSLANKNTAGVSDESRINALIDLAQNALKSQLSARKSQAALFMHSYFITTIEHLSDALDWLQKVNRGELTIDPTKLMYIKSDILGSYRRIVNDVFMNYMDRIPMDETKQNGSIYELLSNDIQIRMIEVEGEFNRALDNFIETDIKNYFEQSVKKSLGNSIYYKRILENTIAWAKDEVNNGTLGIFQTKILGANVSDSPIIRMIHQRLEEIEQQADYYGNIEANKLEQLRVLARGGWDRSSFFNTLTKYYEVDDEGKYTGNLLSAVNRGQYDKEYNQLRRRIYEVSLQYINDEILKIENDNTLGDVDKKARIQELKYKIDEFKFKNSEESMSYPSDDVWRMFQIAQTLWMGGISDINSDKVKDMFPSEEDYNKFKPSLLKIFENQKSISVERVHRRYLPLYYIARACILSEYAYKKEAKINKELSDIKRSCTKSITYTNFEGVEETRLYFDISELPEESYIRYIQLNDMKADLDSPFYFRFNYSDNRNGIIEDIIEKEGDNAEIALLFDRWKRYQADKFKTKPEINETFYKAVKSTFESIINAILNELLELPKDSEQYDQKLEDLAKAKRRLITFESANTTRKVNPLLDEYLISRNEGYEYGDDPVTNRYRLLIRQRNAIKNRIRSSNKQRTLNLSLIANSMWAKLKAIDLEISDIQNKIDRTEIPLDSDGQFTWKELYDRVDVPMIDSNGNEIPHSSYRKHLLETENGISEDDIEFLGNDGIYHPLSILRQNVPSVRAVGLVSENDNEDDLYITEPTGSFVTSQNTAINEQYDLDSDEYILVNADLYKNLKFIDDKIGESEFYKHVVGMLDDIWKNYSGVSRGYKFRLPQRRGSTSQLIARGIKTLGKTNIFSTIKELVTSLTERDTDYADHTVKMPDGTTVESLPIRWERDLEDPNLIDTDLISLMSDAYQEAIRYKFRKERRSTMEAYKFMLSGGFSRTGDAMTSDQSELLVSEINRAIYGRTTTGSGAYGRITPSEMKYAKASKIMRGIMHKKLMSHNWLSVLKNSWDSFWNTILTVYTGKYFQGVNFWNAMKKMGSNFFHSLFTWNRTKVAQGDMTNALINMNGLNGDVNERFQGTYKWGVRRAFSKLSTIEYSVTDLTSKGLITESIYDAYRLVYNFNTGRHEYMNREECELMYYTRGGQIKPSDRQKGYKVWLNSKHTLRLAYKQDEYGAAILDEKREITIDGSTYKIIDLVRPETSEAFGEDKRSRVLETKVRTTIRQMAGTVNGMLDTADRNKLARDYRGALAVAFRGWMIAQAGQYYKKGEDFEQYSKKRNTTVGIESNPDFDGMFNFGTGTIDKGLYRDLMKAVGEHYIFFLGSMLGLTNFGGLKYKLTSNPNKMSIHQYYQLRNAALALDAFLITIGLTALSAAWVGGDGDDDEDHWFKWLIYTALLASISERFPALGGAAFGSQIYDLINSVSVLSAVVKELEYALKLSTDIFTKQQMDKTKTGTFKGKRRIVGNLSRLMSVLGIDLLPELMAMDLAKSLNVLPEQVPFSKDPLTDYTDFHLNWYRNTHQVAHERRGEFYSGLIPTNFISPLVGVKKVKLKKIEQPKQEKGKFDFELKENSFDFNFDFSNNF